MKWNKHILVLIIGMVSSTNVWCNKNFDKGLALTNKHKYEEAIIAFQEVLKSDPTNASTYYNMGHCYFELKKYGHAIWTFEKTLQYDPKNANALKNLEVCHYKLELPPYEPIHSGMWRSFFAVGATNWSLFAIACSVTIALFIFLRKKRKETTLRRLLVIGIIGFTLLGTLFIYLAFESSSAFENNEGGIVTAKFIPTYLNDSGELSPIKITEGTRIKSYSLTKRGMYQVTLANDQELMIDKNGWRKF